MPTKTLNMDIRNINQNTFSKKRFKSGIVDWPWKYSNNQSAKSSRGGFQYPPLRWQDAKDIDIDSIFARDAVMYFWATNPKMSEAIKIIEMWGFTQTTGFPWVKTCQQDTSKPVYRTGYWVSACSEYCFVCTRGNAKPPEPPRPLGLVGPSFQHSRKPSSVHEMIECNEHFEPPYVELFATQSRAGWVCVGNEL